MPRHFLSGATCPIGVKGQLAVQTLCLSLSWQTGVVVCENVPVGGGNVSGSLEYLPVSGVWRQVWLSVLLFI